MLRYLNLRILYTFSFLLIVTFLYSQKKVIAIVPFEVPSDMQYRYDFNGTGLLEKIPTLLEAELFKTGVYEIVERAQLDVLLDEKMISYAGLTDKEYDFSAFKGVDYFVFGKISGFSSDFDNVKINVGRRTMYVNNQTVDITLTVKLVDVNTGKLVNIITEDAETTSKGRPRMNAKSGVSNNLVDKAAKKVVKKIANSINGKI